VRRESCRITVVTLRRSVLCALLLYVTLDLSLPAMPGAFVFDAGESVESVQPSRSRHATAVLVPIAPGAERLPRVEPGPRVAQPVEATSRPHRRVRRAPRAAIESAPPSSDEAH
jgi:hypothetical protein